MATTYETNAYKDPQVVRPQAGQHRRAFTFSLTTGVINDVYKVFKLPKGAKLIPGWYLEVADVDTHATPTATLSVLVTDGTTTKTIIDGTTAPQAGGIATDQTATYGLQTGWVNYKLANNNFYACVKFKAASATHAAGNCTLVCSYLLDTEPGE